MLYEEPAPICCCHSLEHCPEQLAPVLLIPYEQVLVCENGAVDFGMPGT